MKSATPATQKLRCAIYTRKSSEEGLDQAFNSLHAQREACEAYVKSQAGEGWTLIRTAYDDGGFSGGSMERPGLKALMADVDGGRIDVVVVYKVDRLTRALADFAKIVERFDARGVSFVSVTQAFNTTTSMGRLTLNVLLSFAQFEREVTGERIRDKIAASKAKGMWMGGVPPLGYDIPTDPLTRALVVNPVEADAVRGLFQLYLELGSVHELKRELDAGGIVSKAWVTRSGENRGGQPFSRGALFHLLKNRTYLGEIVHKDQRYPGSHPAIIDPSMFDAVQAKLAAGTRRQGETSVRSSTAPLKGKLFDQDGAPMSPTTAQGKGGRRYRYYVSAPLQQGVLRDRASGSLRRIPAQVIEDVVLERCRAWGPPSAELAWTDLQARVLRVELADDSLLVTIAGDLIQKAPTDLERLQSVLTRRLAAGEQVALDGRYPGALSVRIQTRLQVRGGRTWISDHAGAAADRKRRVDPVLIKGLRAAHAMLADLGSEPWASDDRLAEARSPSDDYTRRLYPAAFLAPEIQAATLEGRQPAGLNLERLTRRDLPLAWSDQRAILGF